MKLFKCTSTAPGVDFDGIYAIVRARSVAKAKEVMSNRFNMHDEPDIEGLKFQVELLHTGDDPSEGIVVVIDDKYKQYGE